MAAVAPGSGSASTLLVCTANICRSPMAEALWREAATRLGRLMPVASAGIEATPGHPADLACVELLAARGLDLTEHRATRFNATEAARHELVLVMEPEHQRRIMSAAPMLAGRVHLLGRWGVGPISDPYGASQAAYEECVGRIERAIQSWMNRMSGRASATRSA